MDSNVLAIIISSGCTLIGTIITVIVANNKTKNVLEIKQKSQQHQIEEMKADIKEHNNYATHIPVIETEITNIKESLNTIKDKIGVL